MPSGAGEESEGVRQRRGNAPVGSEPKGQQDGVLDDNAIEALSELLNEPEEEAKVVPGLSHAAKKVKDQLADDPYNMELIWQLGQALRDDGQWDKVSNVLLRGWKRVSEFKDSETRFEYLHMLAKAAFEEKKYKQALAVLNDIEEPAPEKLPDDFKLLRCQIYGFNDEMQKGLKAFNQLIEGKDFDTVVNLWMVCAPAIKQIGAYDVTKKTVEGLAKSKTDSRKVDAIARLTEIKGSMQTAQSSAAATKGQRPTWVTALCVFCVVLVLAYLTKLEAASLKRHGIK